MELRRGDVCRTDDGSIVILSRLDNQGDMLPDGRIPVFHIATVLQSPVQSPGSRWSGKNVRRVAHIGDLIQILRNQGVDFDTPVGEESELEILRRRVRELEARSAV